MWWLRCVACPAQHTVAADAQQLFEYLAIAFSLILSMSAARLLSGLPYAIRAERRYWPHVVLAVVHLVSIAIQFWNFWSFREVNFTPLTFLLALSSPGMMFFISCSLVPENPSVVSSWRSHYYSARQPVFLGLTLWAVILTVGATCVLGLPWAHPARLGHAVLVLCGLLGASFSARRVHAGIAAFAAATLLALSATVLLRAGSLAE